MYTAFCNYIRLLAKSEDIILVGVSGGIDSTVLVDLINDAGYSFAIAHANFGLRDKESDEDQLFVKELAKKYKVPFFTKRLDASGYAKEKGVSIQMAARELRYNWFSALLREHKMQYVAVGHHQMDELETFLRHVTKGTGINGLRGIKNKQGKVIRPLLFADKYDIICYADTAQIAYREDSSNEKSCYERNYIRNQVIPYLKRLNPNLTATFQRTKNKLNQVGVIFEKFAEEQKKIYWQEKQGSSYIFVKELSKKPYATVLLHHWLDSFDFSYDSLEKWILELPHPGKKLLSSTHTLIVERGNIWLLMPNNSQKTAREMYLVKADERYIQVPGLVLSISKEAKTSYLNLCQPSQVATVDYDLLSFPLVLRPWKLGDSFQPIGLEGHQQKVSDLLTNAKCPSHKKRGVYVLTSQEEIVWVLGYRINERFKVTNSTKNIYKLCIQ